MEESDVLIPDANAIKEQYEGKNLTSTDTVKMLDYLVQSVYQSTPDHNSSPYACEFNGLAELSCPGQSSATRNPRADGKPIRSTTLAGLFVDALWATGGKSLTLDEMKAWYTSKDFEEMKDLGLNTVQLLIPTATFNPDDKMGVKDKEFLKELLAEIGSAKLEAVIALVGTGDELDAVTAAARFAASEPAVLALTLPSETTLDVFSMISSIRVQAPKLPVFIPMNLGSVGKISGEFDQNVYGSLSLSHTGTVADIASSESQEDRSKLFYHEATSCMARSPLEFSACFQELPLFVSTGFDLSIDDCVNQGIKSTFKDYGQCGRFEESIESNWWFDHRASLCARQLHAYERGLGWSFAAWKLYGLDSKDNLIDHPAQLLALKDVAKAGLLPDLSDTIPAQDACLNPPANDFVLGDDTLSPTMGPPPDCGNGWWNITTEKCDYWIPPTPAPTEPCPMCEDCQGSGVNPATSGFVGVLVGALVGALVMKFTSKRSQYDSIPN